MSKLFVLNTHDMGSLDKALSLEGEILLIQDAVLFTNNKTEGHKKLNDHKIYALQSCIEKRGMKDRVKENIEQIDVNAMVDLLFSGKTVINL